MTTLTTQLAAHFQKITANNKQDLLCNGLKGIEKESLRISAQGLIAQTPHPKFLGSALTHPHITTDYSESLLEFITPPFVNSVETLKFLHNIHRHVYKNLDNEILLATSMPCGIKNENSIKIADYGKSNIGQMKQIYRLGLSHRYGRSMQAIAGVHFNYSVPMPLFQELYAQDESGISLEEFISAAYFALIRNFQRQGWLLLYLFGASPAICKQFFHNRPHNLSNSFQEFDPHTLYQPYATSLRMSDIGYKNDKQSQLKIDFNTLNGYVESLNMAMNTPDVDYEAIGIKSNGAYQQLNSNQLQIENEYYSTVRPKQISASGEKPTLALKYRGVQYIEIRSLDVNIFEPIGINQHQANFIEAFLLHCLLNESPLQSSHEQKINNNNQLLVAYQGRKPNLQLNKHGKNISLQAWSSQILTDMQDICAVLDADKINKPYTSALNWQQQCVNNSALTPSAKILAAMQKQQQSYSGFSLSTSKQHANYFTQQAPLNSALQQQFDQMMLTSQQQQFELETSDLLSLDEFLNQYFMQH